MVINTLSDTKYSLSFVKELAMGPFSVFKKQGDDSHPPMIGVVRHNSVFDLIDGTAQQNVEETIVEACTLYKTVEDGDLPREGRIDHDGHVIDSSNTVMGYNRRFAAGWGKVFGPRDN